MVDTRSPLELRGVVGKPVEVALEAVPGAGAMWIAQAPPAGCRLADIGTRNVGNGIGGAVLQRFEFTAARPGQYSLEFAYKRRWETEVRALQKVNINID